MSKKYKIVEMLENDDYAMVAKLMDNKLKKKVLIMEMKRESEPVPFINKGMDEAFQHEEAMVLIRDTSVIERPNPDYVSEAFTLRSEQGDLIGEVIYDEEELEELREDPAVYFLSDNFVTYDYASTGGKQFFLMEDEKSPFVTKLDIDSVVESLTIALPSVEADHYLKDYYGLPHDEPIETNIIGFTPLKEEKNQDEDEK